MFADHLSVASSGTMVLIDVEYGSTRQRGLSCNNSLLRFPIVPSRSFQNLPLDCVSFGVSSFQGMFRHSPPLENW